MAQEVGSLRGAHPSCSCSAPAARTASPSHTGVSLPSRDAQQCWIASPLHLPQIRPCLAQRPTRPSCPPWSSRATSHIPPPAALCVSADKTRPAPSAPAPHVSFLPTMVQPRMHSSWNRCLQDSCTLRWAAPPLAPLLPAGPWASGSSLPQMPAVGAQAVVAAHQAMPRWATPVGPQPAGPWARAAQCRRCLGSHAHSPARQDVLCSAVTAQLLQRCRPGLGHHRLAAADAPGQRPGAPA